MAREVFILAIGSVPDPFEHPAAAKRTVEFISKLKGLVGVHPKPPEYTLLCFDSIANAVAARNMLIEFTVKSGCVGNYIMNGEISDDQQMLNIRNVAKDCTR
jgi:hypothetical protein